MNLDDLDYFKKLDTLDMLGEIDNLPDELKGRRYYRPSGSGPEKEDEDGG